MWRFIVLLIIALTIKKGVTGQNITTTYVYDRQNRLSEIKFSGGTTVKYYYDAIGNRLKYLLTRSSICPGESTYFEITKTQSGNTYQWQVNIGNDHTNLVEGTVYTGVNSSYLSIYSPPTNLYGTTYQCVIINGEDTTIAGPFVLRFSVTWTGKENEAWENPNNWNCNTLPDANTDVIIASGVINYPVVNSQAYCRSVIVDETASIKIASGYNLTITGKQ